MDLQEKTDTYRKKRTRTGKNGQVQENVGNLQENPAFLQEKSYISHDPLDMRCNQKAKKFCLVSACKHGLQEVGAIYTLT